MKCPNCEVEEYDVEEGCDSCGWEERDEDELDEEDDEDIEPEEEKK